jgi:ubiquinol-cytochrome c reductase cytochrome c1 subunit
MKNYFKGLLATLLAAPLLALASGGESVHLDRAPVNVNDKVSLQRGAKYFVNHCLNCHSAAYMRYSRLQDLGLTEQQIKDNLMFTTDKVGDTMVSALSPKDAKEWFGGVPPDLTVVSRVRGADWLYTYLRGYYRDDKSPTGWNNVAFPSVGMPHVLHELQGTQVLKPDGDRKGHDGKPIMKLALDRPGTMKPVEYDTMVGDLVNYMVYMGEPSGQARTQVGVFALFFLGFFFIVALLLKNEYWNDVK